MHTRRHIQAYTYISNTNIYKFRHYTYTHTYTHKHTLTHTYTCTDKREHINAHSRTQTHNFITPIGCTKYNYGGLKYSI